MSNTFYKPKNEYGELLISEVDATSIIDNVKDSLIEKIEEADFEITNTLQEVDNSINNRINKEVEILNDTINSKETELKAELARVDEKHSLQIEEIAPADAPDLHEYFRIEMQKRWENAKLNNNIKEFAHTLAETIFIIKSNAMPCSCGHECTCDDIYEEYICINTNGITAEEAPKFTRIGAVDSIIATHRSPGSSILVSDIYNTEYWEEYGKINLPLSGRSVAPIALKAFVDADKAIIEEHNNFKAETTDDIFAIRDQLKVLETEVYDTQEENQNGESRIDRLEKIIGINSCCDNKDSCNIPHHNPSDCCEPDCNILCKINDINIRLDDNDQNDQELNVALEETNNALASLSETTDSRFEEVSSSIAALDEKHVQNVEEIYTTINSTAEEINASIDTTNQSLESAHSRIDSLKAEHDSLVEANRNEHNEIVGIIGANKAEAVSKFYELDKVDAAQNNEIGRIEDKIDREISDRISLAGQYSDLNNRVNDIHTDCVSLHSELSAHEVAAATAHTKFTADISKNAENLEILKVQNSGEHSMFAAKIENNERKLSELQNIVTSHDAYSQGEFNGIKTRVTSAETSISDLSIATRDLNDEVGALINRVENVKTMLDTNSEQTDDNTKDIASIGSRLDVAESSIATNNVERIKDINNLATSIANETAARIAGDTNTQSVCKQYSDEMISQLGLSIDTKLIEKVDTETYEIGINSINDKIGLIEKDTADDINDANTKIAALNSSIESLTTLQETTQTAINSIDTQVSTNTSDIATIKQDIATNLQSINTINSSLETLNNLVDTRQGNINIFAKATLVNGKVQVSKEKILNRIAAGEESFWTITVNSVQEKNEDVYEIIYPEITYSNENIEIVFGNEDAAEKEILISFTCVNTTTNDIITL